MWSRLCSSHESHVALTHCGLGNILLPGQQSQAQAGTSRHAQYNLQTMSNTSLLLQCHNDKSPTFSCIDQGPITVTASISIRISNKRSGPPISEYNICTLILLLLLPCSVAAVLAVFVSNSWRQISRKSHNLMGGWADSGWCWYWSGAQADSVTFV